MTISFILKKEFFNQILNGQKTEEYRDCTDALLKKVCNLDENGDAIDFKPFKEVVFYEGYQKGRREMTVECLGIEVDSYEDTGEDYFVFLLGKILSSPSKIYDGSTDNQTYDRANISPNPTSPYQPASQSNH